MPGRVMSSRQPVIAVAAANSPTISRTGEARRARRPFETREVEMEVMII
jgi:hypothetical protein